MWYTLFKTGNIISHSLHVPDITCTFLEVYVVAKQAPAAAGGRHLQTAVSVSNINIVCWSKFKHGTSSWINIGKFVFENLVPEFYSAPFEDMVPSVYVSQNVTLLLWLRPIAVLWLNRIMSVYNTWKIRTW